IAAASAGPFKVPPLDGEVSGSFIAPLLGGAPALEWHLKVRTDKPRERTVEFSIDGQGAHVRGETKLDPAGEGTWHIAEARIDLAEWFAWLAPKFAPMLADVAMSGTFTATGEG